MSALVLVGCGHLGRALAAVALAGGRVVRATTRGGARAERLRALGVEPVVATTPDALAAVAHPGDDVVVTFPPDGATDATLAPLVASRGPHALAYVSSTGVYGARTGRIDADTAVDRDDARARLRLAAEDAWRAAGAAVVRPPAIYGPESGVHLRLRDGTLRLTEDGTHTVSRIHVDDLARVVLAVLVRAAPGETFVVGDLAPAAQRDVVAHVCARLGLPLPASTTASGAHPTLRADRAVDARGALERLGVVLAYPDYRAGYDAILGAAPR